MPPSCKTGRKQLSRIGGRCFPDLPKPQDFVWFQQCRVSPLQPMPAFPEQLTGSAPALPQLSHLPEFKKEIQNTPFSPLHQVLSAPELGRARLDTVLLLSFNPAVQGEEEKSRNDQLAILNKRSKFPLQLCPSYFIPESLKQ